MRQLSGKQHSSASLALGLALPAPLPLLLLLLQLLQHIYSHKPTWEAH
jgi:hypothetical protein